MGFVPAEMRGTKVKLALDRRVVELRPSRDRDDLRSDLKSGYVIGPGACT
jgi:hypothetical protein